MKITTDKNIVNALKKESAHLNVPDVSSKIVLKMENANTTNNTKKTLSKKTWAFIGTGIGIATACAVAIPLSINAVNTGIRQEAFKTELKNQEVAYLAISGANILNYDYGTDSGLGMRRVAEAPAIEDNGEYTVLTTSINPFMPTVEELFTGSLGTTTLHKSDKTEYNNKIEVETKLLGGTTSSVYIYYNEYDDNGELLPPLEVPTEETTTTVEPSISEETTTTVDPSIPDGPSISNEVTSDDSTVKALQSDDDLSDLDDDNDSDDDSTDFDDDNGDDSSDLDDDNDDDNDDDSSDLDDDNDDEDDNNDEDDDNDDEDDEEFDIEEQDLEYTISGLIVDGINEYEFEGEREIENNESSLEYTIYKDRETNDYIKIEQEVETDATEVEKEYTYSLYEDGNKVSEQSMEYENENNEEVVQIKVIDLATSTFVEADIKLVDQTIPSEDKFVITFDQDDLLPLNVKIITNEVEETSVYEYYNSEVSITLNRNV